MFKEFFRKIYYFLKSRRYSLVEDELSGLPIISSVYPLVEKYLYEKKQIGFLYFDVVDFRKLEEKYGLNACQKLLKLIGNTFREFRGCLFREEDLVVGGGGTDYYVIFLFSPPRHKESFRLADLKLISYRVVQKLSQAVNDQLNDIGIEEKVDFHSGYTLISPDPNMSIERLIYEAQKEAALKCRLEEIMAQFVSNISHELRTPLTCVKGYVETLLEGAMLDADICRRFLEIINEETNRLDRLINDLLDLSMMESRKVEMDLQLITLGKVIIDTVNFLQTYAEKKEIKMEAVVPEALPEAYADEDKIQQVLINLIDNAIKYTPQGGRVWVRAEEEINFLKISVQDTGIGIPPQDVERIFDRFYRVDKGRSVKSGGRGIGLAIARHIVEAHGGIIYVTSKVGEGSTFSFSIPKASALEEEWK